MDYQEMKEEQEEDDDPDMVSSIDIIIDQRKDTDNE